jgi:hypothetical protein
MRAVQRRNLVERPGFAPGIRRCKRRVIHFTIAPIPLSCVRRPSRLREEESTLHIPRNRRTRYLYATPQCQFLFGAAGRSRTCVTSLRKRLVPRHAAASFQFTSLLCRRRVPGVRSIVDHQPFIRVRVCTDIASDSGQPASRHLQAISPLLQAEGGNRTRISSLACSRSATELRPHYFKKTTTLPARHATWLLCLRGRATSRGLFHCCEGWVFLSPGIKKPPGVSPGRFLTTCSRRNRYGAEFS